MLYRAKRRPPGNLLPVLNIRSGMARVTRAAPTLWPVTKADVRAAALLASLRAAKVLPLNDV